MESRVLRAAQTLILLVISALIPASGHSQATAAGTMPPAPSRVDIFGGYSNFRPFNSEIYGQTYDPVGGGTISASGYFNSALGVSAEYSHFFNHPDYCLSSIEAGPVVRHQLGVLVPFAHVLGG
ncbi:MAG TPA: hypothetical protein VJU82_12430, partial [Acidobacteriaceae bacterium]|nr:hypothetical protein [Acidobacteriaceae bacterium]